MCAEVELPTVYGCWAWPYQVYRIETEKLQSMLLVNVTELQLWSFERKSQSWAGKCIHTYKKGNTWGVQHRMNLLRLRCHQYRVKHSKPEKAARKDSHYGHPRQPERTARKERTTKGQAETDSQKLNLTVTQLFPLYNNRILSRLTQSCARDTVVQWICWTMRVIATRR